jgi:hypothetical protein
MRDIRDRAAARPNPRWRKVATGGLASSDQALVLVNDADIDRTDVWWALSGRWPMTVVTNVADAEPPSSSMQVADATALAGCRRGTEPIRIIIPRALLSRQRLRHLRFQHRPYPSIRARKITIRRQQPFQFNARDLSSTLGQGVRPLHRVGDVEHHHHAMAASQHIAFAQHARQYPDGATLALQGWQVATVRRPYCPRTMVAIGKMCW